MNSLLFYIISTSACLSLFIINYLLFLKNNTRFNLCRFYLIAAILFSFIIPFITIDVGIRFAEEKEIVAYKPSITTTQNFEVQELPAEPIQIEKSTWNIDYVRIFCIAFISISLLLFVRFFFRFGSIILIKISGNRYEREDGTNLIFTDRTDNAFSFLGSIFINPLKFTDEEKRLIIEHEREHIRHLHSIDLILIELLIVLQWFNPFAYIARRKLIEIHEFIADNGVIQKGADPYSYQNLLLSVVSSSCLPTVGNQLSALITKKRIAMIGKPLNQTGRWINFLILVPITLTLIIGISAFSPKKVLIENEDDTYKKELIARAEKEGVRNAMQDIYFELNPSESRDQLTTELTKGNDYDLYFYTNNKEDKIHYVINESYKTNNGLTLYAKKLTYIPKESKSLSFTITSEAKSKIGVLVRVCLKGVHQETNLDPQKSVPQDFVKYDQEKIPPMPKLDTLKDMIIEEKYLQEGDEEPFMVVEQMPVFGNGNNGEFISWLASNVRIPKEAAEKGIQGRVFVQFVIEKDGTVTNAKVAKGVDPILDKEALRVVLQSPKWKPGMQRGKIVRVYWTTPVSFLADNGNRPSQTSSNQDADEQAFKVLEKRAQNEIKEVLLKDFRISVKPSNSITYSLILKKGINYTFNFLTDIKNTDVICSLSLKSVDEMVADLRVKNEDFSKLEYTPKETGVYLIQIDNKSPNNLVALVYLSIKDTSIPEQQSSSTIKMEEQKIDDDEVFQVVEQMPVFKNGIEGEFDSWVNSNIQYPKEAAERGVQGRVFVQFIIEKDGSVSNAKILRGINPELDKEALRVVLSSPKWKPAMQNGKVARVYWTTRVTFNSTEGNKISQINVKQETDEQVIKELEKRAEDEAKGTYLKDFKMQIAPGADERYSIILKKGIVYSFYLFSSNKEDQLNTRIDRTLPDKSTLNEKTIDFSYSGNFTFTPEITGAYHLSTKNLSSKNVNSIIYLTIK